MGEPIRKTPKPTTESAIKMIDWILALPEAQQVLREREPGMEAESGTEQQSKGEE